MDALCVANQAIDNSVDTKQMTYQNIAYLCYETYLLSKGGTGLIYIISFGLMTNRANYLNQITLIWSDFVRGTLSRVSSVYSAGLRVGGIFKDDENIGILTNTRICKCILNKNIPSFIFVITKSQFEMDKNLNNAAITFWMNILQRGINFISNRRNSAFPPVVRFQSDTWRGRNEGICFKFQDEPLKHPGGGLAVPDPPEGEGGVVAEILQHHVLAPWMEAQKLRHIVHFVIDHRPALLPRVVQGHLREADHLSMCTV